MTGDFKLSATLRGHDEDVRAVVFPNRHLIFSASRDNTVRQWSLTSPKPPTFDDTIALKGSHWFNGLAYAPPSQNFPKGVVAAGGRETFVFVKQVGQPPDEDAHRMLIGHAGNITCLSLTDDGSKVVSGGWDNQVFLWDVEEGNVIAELKGHDAPVWGLSIYENKFILTACADKIVRVFDMNGKLLQAIKGHTDVVRCFAQLPSNHWSGGAFASAGNDEVIRLWTLEGQPIGELEGHTAYIYSLAILPNGDLVSSSEDRTVKIWRDGQCIQTITHPAISIWTVAACPETGDIVSGASDNIIRVFTRDPERQAAAETLQEFDERNRMYAIPAETAAQGQPFQKENLPGPDALQTQVGQKDGQQLFIRENDGSVTAHLWSASTSQWNLIGTVVEGEGTGSAKKTYDGQDYDYIFDIDIEDGKPPLKLPYNLTESAWDAARKFLERNELPMTYYEQVANWIQDNTKGAKLGQGSGSSSTPQQVRDPWGSDNRYRPGDASSSSVSGQRKLPQRSYVDIIEGNPSNAINIILQKSEELSTSGTISTDQALQPEEVEALKALSTQLQNKQDPRPTDVQTNALLKVASSWPTKSKVPAVGVLALLAVSPSFVSTTSSGSGTVVDILNQAGLLQPRQESANNVVHALRLLVNLFKTDAGRLIVDGTYDAVLELVRPFIDGPESPAQLKALATLYLNYAVLLTSQAPANEATRREARAGVLLMDILRLGEYEGPYASDGVIQFRSLAALGTLLTLGADFRSQYNQKALGPSLYLESRKPTAQSPDIQALLAEINDELR
ncbi:Putative armadillo-like helical, PUL domain, PLAA family ubiquitin binding domain-containing protein [Septoria linicola]|uniref:Armadillo-like helical, PUL domain, PLAA family ubiquitin binding domain-containing protein n=1 Tax=Septoria linicola TaxID=215465 RepID=A0A9Q9EJG9_9PEZI|nr:putative armadillo-like helical, PUL domain, PLAA family ubiquitin binding domain-containing protein [Septoria linicola]USW52172.1 Putative armadillo-like helical, PUL domain, PLAA family ubiquitin binding domain-containing protein [Septoria linicola]